MIGEIFGDPEFWVLIATVVFVALVWKPVRRSLVGSLDARVLRVREELDTARNLREEAERLLATYREKERAAASAAAEIVAHAKAEAERIAARAARSLDEALARRRQLAAERIAQDQAKALAEIRALAVDVAVAAARRAIAAELDAARGAALIDTAIAALPHQLQ
ncbi:MAG TPA: F0F1 ATP synthase subunit B [Stellaceae bacterium]